MSAPAAPRQPLRHESAAGLVEQHYRYDDKLLPSGTYLEKETDNPIHFHYEQTGETAKVFFDLAPGRADNISEGPITIEVDLKDLPEDTLTTGVAVNLQFIAVPELARSRFAAEKGSTFYNRFEAAALAVHTHLRSESEYDSAVEARLEDKSNADRIDAMTHQGVYA